MDFRKLRLDRQFKNTEWKSRECYQAWGKAMMAGRVHEFAPGAAEPNLSVEPEGFDPYAALRQWKSDPGIRREFRGNRDSFLAYAEAVADGRTPGRRLDEGVSI